MVLKSLHYQPIGSAPNPLSVKAPSYAVGAGYGAIRHPYTHPTPRGPQRWVDPWSMFRKLLGNRRQASSPGFWATLVLANVGFQVPCGSVPQNPGIPWGRGLGIEPESCTSILDQAPHILGPLPIKTAEVMSRLLVYTLYLHHYPVLQDTILPSSSMGESNGAVAIRASCATIDSASGG